MVIHPQAKSSNWYMTFSPALDSLVDVTSSLALVKSFGAVSRSESAKAVADKLSQPFSRKAAAPCGGSRLCFSDQRARARSVEGAGKEQWLSVEMAATNSAKALRPNRLRSNLYCTAYTQAS